MLGSASGLSVGQGNSLSGLASETLDCCSVVNVPQVVLSAVLHEGPGSHGLYLQGSSMCSVPHMGSTKGHPIPIFFLLQLTEAGENSCPWWLWISLIDPGMLISYVWSHMPLLESSPCERISFP